MLYYHRIYRKFVFRSKIDMNPDEKEFFAKYGIECHDIIAKGGYGIIYYVYSTQYKSNFALKKIPEKFLNETEIECLKSIDDSYIVSLYQYFKFNGYAYLLMEYCPSDLEKILKIKPRQNPEDMFRYAHDIVYSVKACHDRQVAHSDIKPANFLIDKYGRIKIGDFGLSNFYLNHKYSKIYKGTKLFMAPEIFKRKAYNPMAADVWAIGITLYFMATHQYPFYSPDPVLLARQIDIGVYADEKVDDPFMRQLIGKCLVVNPEKRATIDDIINLPYFTQGIIPNDPSIHSMMRTNGKVVKPQLPKRLSMFSHRYNMFNKCFKSSRIQLCLSRSAEILC